VAEEALEHLHVGAGVLEHHLPRSIGSTRPPRARPATAASAPPRECAAWPGGWSGPPPGGPDRWRDPPRPPPRRCPPTASTTHRDDRAAVGVGLLG
jgi:hypothetical protein